MNENTKGFIQGLAEKGMTVHYKNGALLFITKDDDGKKVEKRVDVFNTPNEKVDLGLDTSFRGSDLGTIFADLINLSVRHAKRKGRRGLKRGQRSRIAQLEGIVQDY